MQRQGNSWKWLQSNFFSVATTISTSHWPQDNVCRLNRRSAASRNHQPTDHSNSAYTGRTRELSSSPYLFPLNSIRPTRAQPSFGHSDTRTLGALTRRPSCCRTSLTLTEPHTDLFREGAADFVDVRSRCRPGRGHATIFAQARRDARWCHHVLIKGGRPSPQASEVTLLWGSEGWRRTSGTPWKIRLVVAPFQALFKWYLRVLKRLQRVKMVS